MSKIYLTGKIDSERKAYGGHVSDWIARVIDQDKRNAYIFQEAIDIAVSMGGNPKVKEAVHYMGQCDLVVGFFDDLDQYKNSFDIGCALLLNKPTLVVIQADKVSVHTGDRFDCCTVSDPDYEVCINYLLHVCSGWKNNSAPIRYHEYIRSDAWREKAEAAKERAGQRCQVCYKSRDEITLDAHHRTYDRLGEELPEDITVLCRDCHSLYETARKSKA